MLLLSISTAFLIASIAHPSTLIGKIMGIKPLRIIGKWSYGIYLWHYPVIILTTPQINTNGIDIVRCIYQIILSVALAVLSFYFIETPIRTGKIKSIISKLVLNKKRKEKTMFKEYIALGVLAVFITATITVFIVFFTYTKKYDDKPAYQKNILSSSTQKNVSLSSSQTECSSQNSSNAPNNNLTSQTSFSKASTAEEIQNEKIKSTVYVLGDSVMINVVPYLNKKIPTLESNCKVGRQFHDSKSILAQLKNENKLPSIVIIALGTNGYFTKKDLLSVIDIIGNQREIIFINSRVQKPWCSAVNELLKEVCPQFSNVILVDWFSASEGHNEYFAKDGVHIGPTGSNAYCELLMKSIQQAQTNLK